MNLQQAILRLSRLQTALNNTWEFYRSNLDTYEELARITARNVLTSLPPQDVDPAQWERTVETIVGRIGTFLVASSKAGGMIVRLAAEASEHVEGTRATMVPGRNISIADIQRFVAAGRAGEEGGKRLDDRDYGKSDTQIAFNILYAIRQGRDNGLLGHIADYLGMQHETTAGDLSPQILAAWIDIIVPRVRADLAAWVALQVKMQLG